MVKSIFGILALILLTGLSLMGQPARTPLDGAWKFALDPVAVGEDERWFAAAQYDRWDKVSVPHSFSVDPRYHGYTGTAWYIKKFKLPAPAAGERHFIRFEAVYYKARIWLNGEYIGAHEGGYTPFELDVTGKSKESNTLVVQVNNAWDTATIPGAKTRIGDAISNNGQLFPWLNYGGIIREVYFITRPEIFSQKVKIEAVPDLKKSAALRLVVDVRNQSTATVSPSVTAIIQLEGRPIPVRFKSREVSIPPNAQANIILEGTISGADLRLWNQDDPVRYRCEVVIGRDTIMTHFGIRKIEVKGTQLLLNGEPIRMGGCNRPLDYPGFGSLDPKKIIREDLTLIKSGNMEFSRMSHYPMSTHILDWADQHGLLIIGEAGNWQMTPEQMANPVMREKFQSQMKEMIERDWNHPSVIAWSVGNEYVSNSPEGIAWTKDMKAFTNTLDTTRPVTFASNRVGRDLVKNPEDEASHYVDFICTNIYGGYLKVLTNIHQSYPDKPVFISEFGIRADQVKSEKERVAHVKKAVEDFRKCDFVIGAAIWTFNDYKSLYPGSNALGYRPWGLVTPEREKRELYYTIQEEFSPATISLISFENDLLKIRITVRNDFPSYTLRGYSILYDDQKTDLGTLRPGEHKSIAISVTDSAPEIALVKPGGFVVLRKTFEKL